MVHSESEELEERRGVNGVSNENKKEGCGAVEEMVGKNQLCDLTGESERKTARAEDGNPRKPTALRCWGLGELLAHREGRLAREEVLVWVVVVSMEDISRVDDGVKPYPSLGSTGALFMASLSWEDGMEDEKRGDILRRCFIFASFLESILFIRLLLELA